MTTSDWLSQATRTLTAAGIATARLDSLVLLEDVTNSDRAYLLAHPEVELATSQTTELSGLLDRRCNHEPLAYIRGFSEFYGRRFAVSSEVLEPRPESETIIDELKQLMVSDAYRGPGVRSPVIVDIGTGSGALAVTAKLEWPQARLIATDIDPACLLVAQDNARELGATVEFLLGNLLEAVMDIPLPADQPLILLCNLPYVPDDYPVNLAAQHEPKLALYAGPDGLDCYRLLFNQVQQLSCKPGHILCESLPEQHTALLQLAVEAGYRQLEERDYIQVFAR